MMFLLHLLRKEDSFFDIGSNVSSYSILANSHVGATTISFEPLPAIVELLKRNKEVNGEYYTFGVQLMMYATTVIYPLSAAPTKYKWLIELNPMTGIIEAFRFGFPGQGELTFSSFGYSVAFTLVALVLGVIIFNKTEKTFVDTV